VNPDDLTDDDLHYDADEDARMFVCALLLLLMAFVVVVTW
jgi:hypothetical protein